VYPFFKLFNLKYIKYTISLFMPHKIWIKHPEIKERMDGLLITAIKAMFVFRNLFFRKSFFKLSCIYLPLEKLVNGKHFPVNENIFRSTKNTFQSKKNLVWFSGKCFFPFSCVCFPESGFRETTFQTFMCLFAIRKVGQRKILSRQRKIWLGFQESVFLENLGGKHFLEVVKKLEMSLFAYYNKFDPQTFDCYI